MIATIDAELAKAAEDYRQRVAVITAKGSGMLEVFASRTELAGKRWKLISLGEASEGKYAIVEVQGSVASGQGSVPGLMLAPATGQGLALAMTALSNHVEPVHYNEPNFSSR